MQEIMATVSGADSGSIILLTRDLSFSDKHRALLELLHHRPIPFDQFDAVRRYLQVPCSMNKLCHDIKHSAWIASPSRNAIQPNWVLRQPPAIKTMHKAADTRPENFIEDQNDKVEYSLAGLVELTQTLADNYNSFSEYVRKVGLVDRRMMTD